MPPRIASSEIRKTILLALEERRYHIYHSSRQYLEAKCLRETALVSELIEQLHAFEIFELPKRNPGDPQKFQVVLRHVGPSLLIHVKIVPKEEETAALVILLGFHPHNTGYPPLPQIPVPTPPEAKAPGTENEIH